MIVAATVEDDRAVGEELRFLVSVLRGWKRVDARLRRCETCQTVLQPTDAEGLWHYFASHPNDNPVFSDNVER